MKDQAIRTDSRHGAIDPSRAPALSRVDSAQIDLLRSVCIFLMLSVHVYPHVEFDTILRGGAWDGVWYVHADILGRASVAVLSFLAGYILWVGGRNRTLGGIVRSRFTSLIVPMMTWNVIYLALATGFGLLQGRGLAEELARHGVETPLNLISAITALHAQPVNVPLGFLRDLFVSIVGVWLVFPWINRLGPVILGLLLGGALLRMESLLILRPSIPLFVFAGAYLAARGATLARLGDPRLMWPAVLASGAAFAVAHWLPEMPSEFDEEAVNLAKRAFLVAAMLVIARPLAARFHHLEFARVRPLLFLAFLSHVIVNQVLGQVWEAAGTGVHSPAYAVFYFLNAPIDIVLAFAGGLVIDRMGRRAQILLRGSARKAPWAERPGRRAARVADATPGRTP